MEITIWDGRLVLKLPSARSGKCHLKAREKNVGFGASFRGRQDPFGDSVYLEWLIGYDAEVQAVKAGDKVTSLTSKTFVGANGKTKYLYELSEILYYSVTAGVVTINGIRDLRGEIDTYDEFIDAKEISVEHHADIELNGLHFAETSIKLPTLFMPQQDGTQIEISIEKQERALSVQPMIYLSIPFRCFSNSEEFRGRSSKKGELLEYEVTNNNISTILNLFRIFGMASAKHKQDTERILDVIIELVEEAV